MSFKRIIAWISIVLLGVLYLATLIMAISGATIYNNLFAICLIATFVVPIFSFAIIWIHGRYTDKKVMGDPDNSDIEGSNQL